MAYLTRSVERVLELLDCFTEEHSEIGVSELSRILGLSKTVTFRIASTLEKHGYLVQDSKLKHYRIGHKFLRLGQLFQNKLDFRVTALPYMEKIHKETDETITLFILRNGKRVCIERIHSTQPLRRVISVGDELPLIGSPGKVLVAFSDDPDVVEASGLAIEELELTRSRGYAISYGERQTGITSVSAPIRNSDGKTVACISIAGPSFRYTDVTMAQYIQILLNSTAKISLQMGFRG